MINEALTKEENKALFRELVKKYHPDMAGGSKEITQKLIDSRVSDAAFERFAKELTRREKPKGASEQKEHKSFVSDEMSDLLVEVDTYFTVRFSGLKYKGVIISCSIFDKSPNRIEIYVKTPNGKEARFYMYAGNSKEEMRAKISKFIDENYLNSKAGYDSSADLAFNRRAIQVADLMINTKDFISTLDTDLNKRTMSIKVSKKDGYPRRFKIIDGVEKMSDEYIKKEIQKVIDFLER